MVKSSQVSAAASSLVHREAKADAAIGHEKAAALSAALCTATPAYPSDALKLAKVPDPAAAIGLALELLSTEGTYADRSFGLTVRTVAAQVRRGHYAFVRRGNRLVAYCGWALCDETIAEAWVEGRGAPDSDACVNGDTVVIVTVVAQDPAALRMLAHVARRQYPGRRMLFHRIYRDACRNRTASFRTNARAPHRAAPHVA